MRAGRAELVQVRHEQTAASCATADVEHGGSPIGVCTVTSGPGAVHALDGLHDAERAPAGDPQPHGAEPC